MPLHASYASGQHLFLYESAQATIHPVVDGSAKVANVFSQVRGKGHASMVLQEVVDYADSQNLELWLEVQRYGNPRQGLDNEQLKQFYQKFGFEPSDISTRPLIMIRKPLERVDR